MRFSTPGRKHAEMRPRPGMPVERRLAEVRTKLARLDEAYLYERSVDQATYLDQRDKLREQETVIQFEVSDATIDSYDVEGLLRFGEHLLTHASVLWSAPIRSSGGGSKQFCFQLASHSLTRDLEPQ
jgi:hypothetical protein